LRSASVHHLRDEKCYCQAVFSSTYRCLWRLCLDANYGRRGEQIGHFADSPTITLCFRATDAVSDPNAVTRVCVFVCMCVSTITFEIRGLAGWNIACRYRGRNLSSSFIWAPRNVWGDQEEFC
jgi:hypothetical protein